MANGDPLWLNEFGHLLKQGELGTARKNSRGLCKLNDLEQHLNTSRILLNDYEHGCLRPERIVKFMTNGNDTPYPKKFDLRPYKDKGHPGWVWELWEVNQRHWQDVTEDCRGDAGNYGYGWVDENGILVGLKDEFVSGWPYTGYMILSQGPYDCTLGGWRTECNVWKYREGRLINCHLNTVTTI